MRDLNYNLTTEINDLARLLERLPKEVFSEIDRKEVLEEAAQPLVSSAQAMAPESNAVHYRYSTPKISGKLRAPKGMGKKAATYHPGNLRRSIMILKNGPFRKSKSVYVGPKISRRANGVYGRGKSVDGYYATMREFGTRHSKATPFMRPAFDSTKNQVFAIAKKGFDKKLRDWEMKNKK